ncbi:MAG TPA: PilZ domain-containing protein [Thermoanaerobaculia bacterium]|nr:PilZ domain-containing protein [Thermoanaerobaculia bacterium]
MLFEHRSDRRLRLKKPAPAMTPSGRMTILDVSTTGMAVAHDFCVKVGDRVLVEFTWNGVPIRLNCTFATTRPNSNGVGFTSGVIVRAGESAALYKRWVSDAVREMVARELTLPSQFSEA